jgi:hypothetical protein
MFNVDVISYMSNLKIREAIKWYSCKRLLYIWIQISYGLTFLQMWRCPAAFKLCQWTRNHSAEPCIPWNRCAGWSHCLIRRAAGFMSSLCGEKSSFWLTDNAVLLSGSAWNEWEQRTDASVPRCRQVLRIPTCHELRTGAYFLNTSPEKPRSLLGNCCARLSAMCTMYEIIPVSTARWEHVEVGFRR